MGTFASVSLYDRGSTRPVAGRVVRVTAWPEGGTVAVERADGGSGPVTTDYYGATPEFMTLDPDVHVVRISAGSASPRTVFSMEKLAAAEPELPPADNDGDVLTVEGGEWVARSGTSVTLVDNGDGTATILASTITNNNDGSATLVTDV